MAFPRKKTRTKEPATKKNSVEKDEAVFPNGIVVFSPHGNAPEFILAEIIISPEKFGEFLDENRDLLSEHEKYGEQLHLTLKESKSGVLYLQVNKFYSQKK